MADVALGGQTLMKSRFCHFILKIKKCLEGKKRD